MDSPPLVPSAPSGQPELGNIPRARENKPKPHLCKYCLGYFESPRKSGKYCSFKCRQAAYRERILLRKVQR